MKVLIFYDQIIFSFTVTVDGVDWTGVKFFQLSSQWQTHIKHFPVVLFGFSES